MKTTTKIPYASYVKVLIVGRLTTNEIVSELTDLDLKLPAKTSDLTEIYNELYETNREYFDKPEDNPYPELSWLADLDIVEGYAYRFNKKLADYAGMEGAFKILEDSKLSTAVSAMAIAKFTEEDIELITNGKYDITYNSEDYMMFFKYFFNTDSWAQKDRKNYCKSIGLSNQDILLFKLATENDKPRLLWKLGFSPGLSLDSMVRSMVEDAHYNFKERQLDDPDEALKWATIFDKMASRLDKLTQEEESVQNMYEEISFSLNQIETATDIISAEDQDIEIPDLAELISSEGAYDIRELLEKDKSK